MKAFKLMAEGLLCIYPGTKDDSGYKQVSQTFKCSRKGAGKNSSWYYIASFDLFSYSKIVSFSVSVDPIDITYKIEDLETADKATARYDVSGLPDAYSIYGGAEINYPSTRFSLPSKTQNIKAVLETTSLSITVNTTFENRMSNGDYRTEGSYDYFDVPRTINIYMTATFV